MLVALPACRRFRRASALLDLSRVQGRFGNAKPEVPRDMYGAEFRRIEIGFYLG
jgi:hypothetical protein